MKINELSEEFMKNAREALVRRGVITKDDLFEVTITDEQFRQFEEEMEVTIPSEVRAYLRAGGHKFSMLKAAVPADDIYDKTPEVMHQIKEMSAEELSETDEELPYLEEIWSDILSAGEDDPFSELRERMEELRLFATLVKNTEFNPDDAKRFIPIGGWMTAGALCIDTSKKREDVDPDDPDTWQLRWFDHDEFDWGAVGYIGDNQELKGDILFPDFETFIKLYFYGIYDNVYKQQLEDEDEEMPDVSTWRQ